MEEREASHMDEVSNQFSNLKSVIDTQSLMGSMETSVPLAYVPMTSPLTLGSSELPYFVTVGATGELVVTDNKCKIIIEPQPSGEEGFYPIDGMYFNSIKYVAHNNYFIEQTHILEGGGVILDQPNGNPVMKVDPSISVTNGSKINIRFYIPRIIGIAGKNSTSGSDIVYIRTNYSHSATYSHGDITYMRIYSDYLNAWNESLHSTNILGKYENEGYVQISMDTSQPPEYVEIRPDGKDIELEITIVDIFAQISPGWIK